MLYHCSSSSHSSIFIDEIYIFKFQYNQMLEFFICDIKFLCFIMFGFFHSNQYLGLGLWPHFC